MPQHWDDTKAALDRVEELVRDGLSKEQAVMVVDRESLQTDDFAKDEKRGEKETFEDGFTPPASVARNARRALEVRETKPESERGMTSVGIARARDLANRKSLSEETVRRMVKYFTRHQSDKKGQTWDEQGKGWQAWMGWGGDEGWSWARGIVERLDKKESK